MAATREEIQNWLIEAKQSGARWLIVVCDSYDYEDYPVAINPNEDFWKRYDEYDGRNMQRIMEVYDLNVDLKSQLSETRSNHCPPRR